jgi:LysM domain
VYCDTIFTNWLNQSSLTTTQNCSDCMLGVIQMQLNSPFGYHPEFAADFKSLTSSCGATNYPFTTPTAYTIATGTTTTSSASVTATPLPAGCVTLYTIQAGDTCNRIALAKNVSTFAVYGATGISNCTNLPTGSQICLLGQCLQHQVKDGDTCDSIIAANGNYVSPTTFRGWNPNINPLCSNIADYIGDYLCLRSAFFKN